jgi:glycosyltransferase involved in cell wall biosynthesis
VRVGLLGAFPPTACGVADYCGILARALEARGISVVRLGLGAGGSWPGGLGAFLARRGLDVLHVQYPAVGLHRTVAPHLLALLPRRCAAVVTLHEFSRSHPLRRLADGALARADFLLFTTDYERRAFAAAHPAAGAKAGVLPIACNLPPALGAGPRRRGTVVYFGLLRPGRGIEEFLRLAELSQRLGRPYRFLVIGRPQEGRDGYARALRGLPGGTAVQWLASLPAQAVADELAACEFAYLPYPDGATERRGSLIAALAAGLDVLTTRSAEAPADLERCVRFAPAPAVALRLLDCAPEVGDSSRRERSEAVRRFLAARAWSAVADGHVRVYERLAGRPGAGPGGA